HNNETRFHMAPSPGRHAAIAAALHQLFICGRTRRRQDASGARAPAGACTRRSAQKMRLNQSIDNAAASTAASAAAAENSAVISFSRVSSTILEVMVS